MSSDLAGELLEPQPGQMVKRTCTLKDDCMRIDMARPSACALGVNQPDGSMITNSKDAYL